MNETELEDFRNQDWQEIATKVLKGSLILAVRYGWTSTSSLPGGKTLEDLVIEAISELFENPQRVKTDIPVTTQLRNIVRQKLWNASQSSDGQVERSDTMEEIAEERFSEPEHAVEVKDEFERAIELLECHPKVERSDDLQLVLLALGDGAFDVPEIVEQTGLTRDRVYQLTRELSAIYPSIARDLHK